MNCVFSAHSADCRLAVPVGQQRQPRVATLNPQRLPGISAARVRSCSSRRTQIFAAGAAAGSAFDFRSFFDRGDYADVLLRTQPEPATSRDPDGSGRLYKAHAIVLAARSSKFRTMLMDSPHDDEHDEQQPGDSKDRKDSKAAGVDVPRELKVPIRPEEEAAMELLLRLIYGYDLPALTPDAVPLLFACKQLADRFECPHCVEQLLAHVKGAASDAATLRLARSTPSDFKPVSDSDKQRAVQRFEDVPAVIIREQLRREFCSLPFAAVLAWAESDALRVDSENSVVYLLSAWVLAAQEEGGQGVSDEQLEQLAYQVRVLHLGPAYQHHILPQLEWFKGCSGMAWLPTLCTYKQWETRETFQEADRTIMQEQLGELWKGPKQWLAKARRRAGMTNADRVLNWEVGGEQLQELYDGGMCGSPTIYMCGFHMEIFAKAYSTRDDQARTFGMFFAAHSSQVHNTVPWLDSAALPVGNVKLKVQGGCKQGSTLVWGGAEEGVAYARSRCMRGSIGWGSCDILQRSAPTTSELLAPYLRDGKLHLEARFTYVDCP